ncbi:MAG: WecB/TagA/CpsF family glycosyltransferase [Clostridiales bacterium]|jgi:N-acetylglucosaminyldiphosphoundecaprenol N-acetyl-beta-D-mannosaminyltransferase|nr:WecB/TagA/CpsF family glycosyltransferase [Clostridiales bacterium]
MNKEVNILGVPFDSMPKAEALEILRHFLTENKNHLVVTPNPEAVMLCKRDEGFKRAVLGADLRFADGIGIIIASKIIKDPIPERVSGCDTAFAFLQSVAPHGKTVYLLGAAPGVAEAAKINLEKSCPGLRVTGIHHGYFNGEEEAGVLEEIKTLRPDVLILGMGMPRQEKWAAAHRDLPARITFCAGGSIDVWAGKVKRAPEWMRRAGLEWLYRLASQPVRAKRMLDLPRFLAAIILKG